jgi:hypothetical protein
MVSKVGGIGADGDSGTVNLLNLIHIWVEAAPGRTGSKFSR